MIPIRDANPTSRTAYVTLGLIALNVFVFLFLEPITRPDREQLEYFVCRAAIPYEVTHLDSLGDSVNELPPGDARDIGRFQRQECPRKSVLVSIFFSMFLHGGFLHIAGNMLYLWVFGNNVEDRLGPVKYLLFYLGCGLVATLAQAYVTPSSPIPLVGASGAVAGVLGAYLLMFPRARVTTLVIFFFITMIQIPAVIVLGLWFLLQLFQTVGSVQGETGGVAYMAHVGGFVAGMLLALVLKATTPRPRYGSSGWYP